MLLLCVLAACSPAAVDDGAPSAALDRPTTTTTLAASTSTRLLATTVTRSETTDTATTDPTVPATAEPTLTRPEWLGERVLVTVDDGSVVTPQTTPAELSDRRLPTVDLFAAPDADRFEATSGPVPDDVIARSTWDSNCPVSIDELAYLNLSFWGFDGRPHTGEMIVNVSVVADVITVFETLFVERFPIEEMRVVTLEELDAPPTGDGNNTTAFVCRPVVGGTRFSQHAYGLAVDINPFHNPYIKGDLILPELAVDYLDRTRLLPGMIVEGDVVVQAFDDIGWGWGGRWRSLTDTHHFSLNDR
jgi:hypothetical protein